MSTASQPIVGATVSVVIPAHDESRVLPRTLQALRSGGTVALDVVVVCNGCTDDTADVARAAAPPVRVVEIEEPSKAAAVRAGNATVTAYPRVHLDADVELTGASLEALVRPILAGQAHATAPRRELPRTGCSLPVRWYYDVWEQLPTVRAGLYGRGVIALSETGQQRVSALPQMLSDDLAISEAFEDDERRVVEDAVVVVHPARTLAALVDRRVRVVTGNQQADDAGVRRDSAATSPRDLLRIVRRDPRMLVKVVVFAAVTLRARSRARAAIAAGDFTTWKRDESSRA